LSGPVPSLLERLLAELAYRRLLALPQGENPDDSWEDSKHSL
jgi:hypothetical protein